MKIKKQQIGLCDVCFAKRMQWILSRIDNTTILPDRGKHGNTLLPSLQGFLVYPKSPESVDAALDFLPGIQYTFYR